MRSFLVIGLVWLLSATVVEDWKKQLTWMVFQGSFAVGALDLVRRCVTDDAEDVVRIDRLGRLFIDEILDVLGLILLFPRHIDGSGEDGCGWLVLADR